MSRSFALCLLIVAPLIAWMAPAIALAADAPASPDKKAPPPEEQEAKAPEKPGHEGQYREPPSDLGKGLKQVGPTRWELKRDEMVRLILNAPIISRQLWVREVKKDGKLVGHKLKHIQKGSLVYRAGFRNGDVVTRIAGQRLTRPEALLLTIGAMDRIEVQLYRAGKLRKHVFEVIP